MSDTTNSIEGSSKQIQTKKSSNEEISKRIKDAGSGSFNVVATCFAPPKDNVIRDKVDSDKSSLIFNNKENVVISPHRTYNLQNDQLVSVIRVRRGPITKKDSKKNESDLIKGEKS